MSTANSLQDAASLVHHLDRWITKTLLHEMGLLQVGVAVVTYLAAWALSHRIERYLEAKGRPSVDHFHFRLGPAPFALVSRCVIWLFGLWFFQVLFAGLGKPVEAFRLFVTLALALLAVRIAGFFIRSSFWRAVFSSLSICVIALHLLDLWDSTSRLLDSMRFQFGVISFSVWGIAKAVVVFTVLWALGAAARRLFAQWIKASSHLTYSDRVLLQRVFNAAVATLVLLFSLHAAGLHIGAVAFTGGVIGVAIGIGLQKLGSNMVCGIHLLLSKPIRLGDVIVLHDAFSGARYGWVTRIGLNYVHLATRDGTEHIVPNETFVTGKIENLSYSDNRVRLRIPFGISYESDLKKATTLALEAARGTDRVLKAPEPACLVTAFGDSNVMFEVRVWIEDPHLGIGRVRSGVYRAIWDIFHENGIQFAFPQRDVHIIDGGARSASA